MEHSPEAPRLALSIFASMLLLAGCMAPPPAADAGGGLRRDRPSGPEADPVDGDPAPFGDRSGLASTSAGPFDRDIDRLGRDALEAASQAGNVPDAVLEREAHRVLDDWHQAAAVGARDRYLVHFAKDAVFLGTDASERWDLATFTSYVDEHFTPGRGWAYDPKNRYVLMSEARDIAWFDEELISAGYGALRGTGVLRRVKNSWKIVHYSMTFTIPNGIAKDVVEVVRGFDQ